MKFDVFTLFPEMISGYVSLSLFEKARQSGVLDVRAIDIRDYASGKHRQCDDLPYGGGAGMVMKPEPIVEAFEANKGNGRCLRIYMSPQGRPLDQQGVERLAQYDTLQILCGRYEGVDQRALDLCIDEEWSIGDYVLAGGELAACVLIEAVARYIPGFLGSEQSLQEESFGKGMLEHPHYTRPRDFRGESVPEVLLSGNHEAIAQWRQQESFRATKNKRPDLLEKE
jgi:tRNA (guanine37-N1)-methyltransferase